MSYDGPGIYRHWKGGYYRALGIGEAEIGGYQFVVYQSLDVDHELERRARGADFVLRPLNDLDGPDAFNRLASLSTSPTGPQVTRFRKLAAPDRSTVVFSEAEAPPYPGPLRWITCPECGSTDEASDTPCTNLLCPSHERRGSRADERREYGVIPNPADVCSECGVKPGETCGMAVALMHGYPGPVGECPRDEQEPSASDELQAKPAGTTNEPKTPIAGLLDELEHHFAYDCGDTDSGTKDPQRRKELVALVDAMSEDELRVGLSEWLRVSYLSDKGLAQGYGWEDALAFCKWIDEGEWRGPNG